MSFKLSGVWAALPTPFINDAVDYAGIKKLCRSLLDSGIHGLSPCGTTGEGSSLSDEEFSKIVETVLREANGKVPVAPGTGSNNTQHTISRTKMAKELGASVALTVTPYYVKPNQDGIVRHYSEVSKHVDLPMILYNVPGRTAVNAIPETVEKICNQASIVAVKECASLPQAVELIERLGKRITILSGEDNMLLPFLSVGGHGMISVVANAYPKEWVQIYESYIGGQIEKAKSLFLNFREWTELMFIETNPLPLKFVLSEMKFCSPEVRSPLAPLSSKNAILLKSKLSK